MSQTLLESTGRLHVSDDVPALLARIDEITPLLKSQADGNEELGRLTDKAVQALHDSGVFRLGIPRELGGYEASPARSSKSSRSSPMPTLPPAGRSWPCR